MAKTTITKQCEICGGDYQTPPSNADRRRTCSRACAGELRRHSFAHLGGKTVTAKCNHCGKQVTKHYSPSRGVPKNVYCNAECQQAGRAAAVVELTCARCGKQFERLAYLHSKRGKRGPYCSRECLNERASRVCEVCGVEFDAIYSDLDVRATRYCSIECMRVGMAQPVIACQQCGAEFNAPHSTSKFCSHNCYSTWLSQSGVMSGENHLNWRGGLSYERRRGASWRKQRLKALRRDKYKCRRCGATKDDGAQLHVHHRVPYRLYDGDHEAANRVGNLLTMCVSCHTTLEWQLARGERLF